MNPKRSQSLCLFPTLPLCQPNKHTGNEGQARPKRREQDRGGSLTTHVVAPLSLPVEQASVGSRYAPKRWLTWSFCALTPILCDFWCRRVTQFQSRGLCPAPPCSLCEVPPVCTPGPPAVSWGNQDGGHRQGNQIPQGGPAGAEGSRKGLVVPHVGSSRQWPLLRRPWRRGDDGVGAHTSL